MGIGVGAGLLAFLAGGFIDAQLAAGEDVPQRLKPSCFAAVSA